MRARETSLPSGLGLAWLTLGWRFDLSAAGLTDERAGIALDRCNAKYQPYSHVSNCHCVFRSNSDTETILKG